MSVVVCTGNCKPAQPSRLMVCPSMLAARSKNLRNIQSAERIESQDHSESQAHIRHGVDQESLGCRVGGGLSLRPMRDQEIGTNTHGLPAHVGHQQVSAHDQHDHGGCKKTHDREEAAVSRISDHVSRRVNVDDGADAGDQQKQQYRELIDIKTQVDGETARLQQPVKRNGLRSISQNLNEGRYRQEKGQNYRRNPYFVACFTQPASCQREDDRRPAREEEGSGYKTACASFMSFKVSKNSSHPARPSQWDRCTAPAL